MKITKALAEALDLVREIIEPHNTIPILSNVRLRNNGASLYVEATDLDVQIAIELGRVDWPTFDTTVPFVVFDEIAERDICQVAAVDGQLAVNLVNYTQFFLNTLAASDYPAMKPFEPATVFDLSSPDLLADLAAVKRGVSTEETRYYLNGVFMHRMDASKGFVGDHLRFVTTDGHRLFCVSRPLPKGAEEFRGVIIPTKAISVLMKALAQNDGDVTVAIDAAAARVRFTLPGLVIDSKTIDGTYPDYHRVIPEDHFPALICCASDLARAAMSVSLIATERTRAVIMTFGSAGNMSVSSPENGRAVVPIPGEFNPDMPARVGLNARYLVECCAAFGDSKIRLSFQNESAPFLIVGLDGEAQRLTVVQMPMRV